MFESGLTKRISLVGLFTLAALLVISCVPRDRSIQLYSERTDILRAKPALLSEIEGIDNWSGYRWGYLEAAAEIIELYPQHELYFLARDSENFYDLTRALLRNDRAALSRLHLLNVSRTSVSNHTELLMYLEQEGISEPLLQAGRKILLIDTGYEGTIPREIKLLFQADLRRQIQTHLLCSKNKIIPSTRVFLGQINAETIGIQPEVMREELIEYEDNIPKYTNSSTGYQNTNGRWQPVSPFKANSNVNVKGAKQIQSDLLAFANQPEIQIRFQERRNEWRQWIALESQSRLDELKQILIDIRGLSNEQKNIHEAMVRDFLEFFRLNQRELQLTEFELGLRPEITSYFGSNKSFVIKKYPEWESVLVDLRNLDVRKMSEVDLTSFTAVLRELDDLLYLRGLIQKLAEQPIITPVMMELALSLAQQGHADFQWKQYILGSKHWRQHRVFRQLCNGLPAGKITVECIREGLKKREACEKVLIENDLRELK